MRSSLLAQGITVLGFVLCGHSLGGCAGGEPEGATDPRVESRVVCTPGTSCFDAHTMDVCSGDGTARFLVPCSSFEVCDGGLCVADPNLVCSAAQDSCVDATTALRCGADRRGFEVITCPTGTSCDRGLCRGACIVGSSYCDRSGTLVSCLDGMSYVRAVCGAGEACVFIEGGEDFDDESDIPPVDSLAACKPSTCTPSADYWCEARRCGNLANPSAPDQDTTYSRCVPTPEGYRWVPIHCAATETCSPSVTSCNDLPQAGCRADCVPGDERCVDWGAYVVCGADGRWQATPVACNESTGDARYTCFADHDRPNRVVCGDFACAAGEGACDSAGLHYPCGPDHRLATVGSPCAVGACVSIGDPADTLSPWTPGECRALCAQGEERCFYPDSSTYEVCTGSGVWSGPLNCADGELCTQFFVGSPPMRKKSCGADGCVAGAQRCSDVAGAAAASGADHYVQTCGNDAEWADPISCSVGDCRADPSHPGIVGCVAECLPNAPVCMGATTTVPGTDYAATTQDGICSNAGRRPAVGTACGAGTYCRVNITGADTGCAACVPGLNEFGLTDTRCANGDTQIETCVPNGSGWNTAGAQVCGAGSPVCYPATVDTPIPENTGPYCHRHPGWSGEEYPVTDSFLKGWGQDETCESNQFGVDYGPPVPCPLRLGGSVGDCCSSYCRHDPYPRSAYCSD